MYIINKNTGERKSISDNNETLRNSTSSILSVTPCLAIPGVIINVNYQNQISYLPETKLESVKCKEIDSNKLIHVKPSPTNKNKVLYFYEN